MEFKYLSQSVVLFDQDVRVGEIQYRFFDDTTIDVYHTFVNPQYRGQGIAGKLLNQLMTIVEENQYQVIPSCSYVAKAFSQNPDFQKYQAKNL